MKNVYLYGEVIPPQIPQEIITKRIEILNINLHKLLNENYKDRDYQRIDAIMKAIKFWKTINSN